MLPERSSTSTISVGWETDIGSGRQRQRDPQGPIAGDLVGIDDFIGICNTHVCYLLLGMAPCYPIRRAAGLTQAGTLVPVEWGNAGESPAKKQADSRKKDIKKKNDPNCGFRYQLIAGYGIINK